MGIDLKLTLPANVTVSAVADVLGRLLGCPVVRRPLSAGGGPESRGAWSADVVGVTVSPSNMPECAKIEVASPLQGCGRQGCGSRRFLYHFEFDSTGARGIILRSWGEHIALAVEVARFFGGRVLYSDHADPAESFVEPAKSDALNHPEDGAPWQDLQLRIEALQPLTQEQIAGAERFAAYKNEDA